MSDGLDDISVIPFECMHNFLLRSEKDNAYYCVYCYEEAKVSFRKC